MLDTLPYADLLAIHNALADKPARRFDTRANGEKRTLALMEARGLTLEDAARLADVVLGGNESGDLDPPVDAVPLPEAATDEVTITAAPEFLPLVSAFIAALAHTERPAYFTTFLRRLTGEDSRQTTAPRERQITPSQRTIIELCSRPQGATGKELADECGWPSIAARATCQKLAERFGYTVEESPKVNGRGISFRMIAKQVEA